MTQETDLEHSDSDLLDEIITNTGDTADNTADTVTELEDILAHLLATLSADDAYLALIGITLGHHKIHDGDSYHTEFVNEDLDAAAVLDIVFVTPDTAVRAHWTPYLQTTLAATMQLYQGITEDADGVAMVEENREHNSDNTADLVATSGNTVTDLGILRQTWVIGTTGTGIVGGTGGTLRERLERVLDQDSKYLLRITSNAANNKVIAGGDWYEV